MKYLIIILFKLVEKNMISDDNFVFLMSFDVEVFVKFYLYGFCGRYQYGLYVVYVVRVGCRVVG